MKKEQIRNYFNKYGSICNSRTITFSNGEKETSKKFLTYSLKFNDIELEYTDSLNNNYMQIKHPYNGKSVHFDFENYKNKLDDESIEILNTLKSLILENYLQTELTEKNETTQKKVKL